MEQRRQGKGTTKVLPKIRNNSPHGNSDPAWQTPRAPSRTTVRVEVLGDQTRVLGAGDPSTKYQEATMQKLLERTQKIKDEIDQTLNATQSSWQEEKRARELLQDHIRTITDVVRKLSINVQGMEAELHARPHDDGLAAVKNAQIAQDAGLLEVRGKITRADAFLARLASDLKHNSDTLHSVMEHQQHYQAKVTDNLGLMDTKVTEISGRLERASNEHVFEIKHFKDEATTQLNALETRVKHAVEELNNALNAFKALDDAERGKLETRVIGSLERETVTIHSKIEKLEQKLESALVNLLRQYEKRGQDDEQRVKIQLQSEIQQLASSMQSTTEAAFTDLRNRVARLDNVSGKATNDMKSSSEAIKSIMDHQQHFHTKVTDTLAAMEAKIAELSNRLEQTLTQNSFDLRNIEAAINNQVANMEARNKFSVDEVRGTVNALKMQQDAEREKLESRVTNYVERELSERTNNMDKSSRKLEGVVTGMQHQVARLSEDFNQLKNSSSLSQQVVERSVSEALDQQLKGQDDSIGKLRAECQSGFAAVHESMSSMKRMTDGKLQLIDEQLKKDLGALRKMVVLI